MLAKKWSLNENLYGKIVGLGRIPKTVQHFRADWMPWVGYFV